MRSIILVLLLRIHQALASTNCRQAFKPYPSGDCVPLAWLYENNGGKNWNHNENWFYTYLCSDKSEENWSGVACTEDDSVSSLTLSQNNLHNSIPTAIGMLSNLTGSLDLSYNNLTSQIPSQIAYLTGITRLDLSYNALTGNIPIEVAELCAKLNDNTPNSCLLEGNSLPSPSPTCTHNPTTTSSPTSDLSQFPSSVPTPSRLTMVPSYSPSSATTPEPLDNGLIAASVGIVLLGGICIALCVLLEIKKTSLCGTGIDPTSASLQGYVPFQDNVSDIHGDSHDVKNSLTGYGISESILNGARLISDEGSDRESFILPGVFDHALKAYLIQLKDLNLEKKPFAAGGSGQVQ